MGRFFPPRQPIPIGNVADPRQYQGRPPRGDYFDRERNPAGFTLNHDEAAGAGGLTSGGVTVWSYTVPNGRTARVESAKAMVRNNSATATYAGQIICLIQIAGPNINPGETPARLVWASFQTGETAVFRESILGHNVLMQSGSVLSARMILDTGTAGADIRLQASASVTEFDT